MSTKVSRNNTEILRTLKQLSVAKSFAIAAKDGASGCCSWTATAALRTIKRDATKSVAISASLNWRYYKKQIVQHSLSTFDLHFRTWDSINAWPNCFRTFKYSNTASILAWAAPNEHEAEKSANMSEKSRRTCERKISVSVLLYRKNTVPNTYQYWYDLHLTPSWRFWILALPCREERTEEPDNLPKSVLVSAASSNPSFEEQKKRKSTKWHF